MIHATRMEARLRSWLMSSKSDRGGQLEDKQIYCSSTGKHEFLGGLLFNAKALTIKQYSFTVEQCSVLYKTFSTPSLI